VLEYEKGVIIHTLKGRLRILLLSPDLFQVSRNSLENKNMAKIAIFVFPIRKILDALPSHSYKCWTFVQL